MENEKEKLKKEKIVLDKNIRTTIEFPRERLEQIKKDVEQRINEFTKKKEE